MLNDTDDLDEGWFARNWVTVVSLTVGIAAVSAFVFFVIASQDSTPVVRQVQQVTLLAPPPPPKVELPKPPEPEPVKQPEFEDPKPFEELKELPPLPEAPPPAPLGIDAVGQGAGDAFGLVGRPGGRGLMEGTGAGGGGGDRLRALYARSVESAVRDALNHFERTRYAAYRPVTVQLWIEQDGRVTQARLRNSTGDPDLDRALVRELFAGFRLSDGPPPGTTMPVVIRLEGRSSRPS